ncbi:alpha/beta fold hydrolase [Pseudochelatococcus sp. B33]
MDHHDTLVSPFDKIAYQVNGTNVVALTAGKGPALVFLHGTGTFPGFDMALEWARTHRVVIPFHANFGESGDNETVVTVEDHVLHYMDLFDLLKLDGFALAGFSFGGWIAAEFAIRQPDRLTRLVLAAPAGLVVEEAPAPDLFNLSIHEVPKYLTHDPDIALRFFPKQPDPQFNAKLGREMQGLARALVPAPHGNPRLATWAHRIRMPTLLMWGEHDRLMPVAHAAHWQRLLPDCRLEYVMGAGHLMFEERPDCAHMVTSFLAN